MFKTPARIWLKSDKPMARIARNLLWLASGKGVGALLSLVYLGMATRTLGVEGFGQFALIIGMGGAISQLVQFDCWQVVMRFGAARLHAGDARGLGRLIAACRLFDIGGMALGIAIAALVTLYLRGVSEWQGGLAEAAFLYCAAILLSIRSTPTGLLRLHNRFDLSSYAETVTPVVRMIGTVGAMMLRPDITGFLIAWAASEAACAVAFWLLAWRVDAPALAWRHSRHFRQTLREEEGLPRFLLVTNLGSTLGGLAGQAPVLLLGSFVSAAAAGLFRLAAQLTQGLSKVSTLISRSVYAEMNHVRARGGMAAIRRLLLRANRVTMVAGAVLILVIALFGKPLLGLIAGEAFIAAYPMLLLLGAAAAVNFMGVSYEPALLASTDGVSVLKLKLLMTTLFLALLGGGIALGGAQGAAAASLVSAICGNIIYRIALRRKVHEPALEGDADAGETEGAGAGAR